MIPEEAFGASKLSSICTRSYPRAQWAQARGEDSRRKKLLFLPSAYGHWTSNSGEAAKEGNFRRGNADCRFSNFLVVFGEMGGTYYVNYRSSKPSQNRLIINFHVTFSSNVGFFTLPCLWTHSHSFI